VGSLPTGPWTLRLARGHGRHTPATAPAPCGTHSSQAAWVQTLTQG